MTRHALAIVSLLLLGSTGAIGIAPYTTSATAATVGWTDGTHSRSKGVRIGTATEQGIAIRLPAAKAELLRGQTISAVNAAFCSSRMSDVVLFIASDLDGDYLYSQSLSSTSSSWKEYTLDTPYELTGDELYIGFTGSISTSYSPLSFDYSDGQQATSYVLNDGTWEDAYDYGYGSANIQLVLGSDYSFADAVLRPVTCDGYYKSGTEYDITVGQLFNFGTDTISTIELTYSIGTDADETGVGPYVLQLTDLSLAGGTLYDLTLPAMTFDQDGIYYVDLSISSVNDAADADTTDNTGSTTIAVYPQDMKRLFLVENFTTQQCTNCPTGHATLQSAVGDRDDVAVVAHHSGYYTDAFTMTEDIELLVFNSSSSGGTFAPAFMTNRYRSDSQSSSYPAPAFYSDADGITSRLDELALLQPYVGVEINSTYDDDTRLLSGTVDVTAYATPPADLYLNLYIVQDSIVAAQTSGGSSYTHRHVFRGTIDTGTFGTAIDVEAGETLTYEFSYTVPTSITSSYTSSLAETFDVVLDNMSLVAFVSTYNADDVNDCIVYNAAQVPFVDDAATTGIKQLQCRQTAGSADTAIYTLDGRRIATTATPGIYIERRSDGTVCKKVKN